MGKIYFGKIKKEAPKTQHFLYRSFRNERYVMDIINSNKKSSKQYKRLNHNYGFVQISEKYIEVLSTNNSLENRILFLFVRARDKKTNVVKDLTLRKIKDQVISGGSNQQISDSIKSLFDKGMIDIVHPDDGRKREYIVNPELFWSGKRSYREKCYFGNKRNWLVHISDIHTCQLN